MGWVISTGSNVPKLNRIIELQVSDNGVGVPQWFDFRTSGKMGLQGVFAIGEHQLQGEVKFEARHGVVCRIRFRDTLYHARM
jgi:two-component sensor histidine kinase